MDTDIAWTNLQHSQLLQVQRLLELYRSISSQSLHQITLFYLACLKQSKRKLVVFKYIHVCTFFVYKTICRQQIYDDSGGRFTSLFFSNAEFWKLMGFVQIITAIQFNDFWKTHRSYWTFRLKIKICYHQFIKLTAVIRFGCVLQCSWLHDC